MILFALMIWKPIKRPILIPAHLVILSFFAYTPRLGMTLQKWCLSAALIFVWIHQQSCDFYLLPARCSKLGWILITSQIAGCCRREQPSERPANLPSLSVACACMCGRLKPRIECALPTKFHVELIHFNSELSVNVLSDGIDVKKMIRVDCSVISNWCCC